MMSVTQQIITVCVMIIGTMATRFLPFLLVSSKKPTPKIIRYLGIMLPSAALGLLVVYSFKDVTLFSGSHGLPELIATAVVVVLHLWKRQMLLSIAGGTVLYMILVQFVF